MTGHGSIKQLTVFGDFHVVWYTIHGSILAEDTIATEGLGV